MSRNSDLPTFGDIFLWTLNIAIFAMYLYPLRKLKTVLNIFMKFLTNVKKNISGYAEHKNPSSG